MADPKEYNVRVAGGRMIPVTASSDDEARKMVRDILMKESAAEKGAAGGIDNFTRSVVRGASSGASDEVKGAVQATIPGVINAANTKLFDVPDWFPSWAKASEMPPIDTNADWGTRYNQVVDTERAQDNAYDSAFPVTSTAGKIGGALYTMKFLPPWLKPSGGGNMLPAAAKMGGAGAVVGAAQGFGEGEGGFWPRVQNAVKTGLLGLGFGAGAVPVGRGLGSVASTVGNWAAETDVGRRIADKWVGPGMRAVADKIDDFGNRIAKPVQIKSLSSAAPDDGAMVPPQTWVNDAAEWLRGSAPTSGNILDDAAARRIGMAVTRGGDDVPGMGRKMTDTGTDWMPVDTNEMTRRLGTVIHSSPGPGPGVINTALDARNRGTPGRMLGTLGDEANVPPIHTAEKYLIPEKGLGTNSYISTEGRAIYDPALRGQVPFNMTPELQALKEKEAIKKAFETVAGWEREHGRAFTDAERAHMVKRALNANADAAMSSGAPVDKSLISGTAGDWESALWKGNPHIQAADEAYAKIASLPDWMKRGQNFMRSGTSDAATEVSPAALAADLPAATEGQKTVFKVGTTNTIKDTLAQGPDSARRLAKAVDTNELLRQKLTEIYGPDVAERMMKQSAIERNLFAKTDNVVRGNSNTAMKIGAMLDDAATADLPTTSQGLVSRLLSSAGEAYQKARAGNESVRERVAQMLTETDPVLNAELMAKIERQLQMAKRARPGQRAVATGATRATE